MNITEPKIPSCNDCEFAAFLDYGYSNYTVEGTDFHCMKGLNPEGSFDRFYGEDKRLAFAVECAQFTDGEPFYLDVDMELLEDATPDQRAWFDSDSKGW